MAGAICGVWPRRARGVTSMAAGGGGRGSYEAAPRCAWRRRRRASRTTIANGASRSTTSILFEFLTLEGAQAGLSWETILRKREGYRSAFARFDPAAVARFTPARVERLLQNPAIVRHRLKIEGTVRNAWAFRKVQKSSEFRRVCMAVRRRQAARESMEDASHGASADRGVRRAQPRSAPRGFTFVGSTIRYAFMQAVGLVNDHTVGCFRLK